MFNFYSYVVVFISLFDHDLGPFSVFVGPKKKGQALGLFFSQISWTRPGPTCRTKDGSGPTDPFPSMQPNFAWFQLCMFLHCATPAFVPSFLQKSRMAVPLSAWSVPPTAHPEKPHVCLVCQHDPPCTSRG